MLILKIIEIFGRTSVHTVYFTFLSDLPKILKYRQQDTASLHAIHAFNGDYFKPRTSGGCQAGVSSSGEG